MGEKVRKNVSDLGQAAFVKMHGFKCAGRRGRIFAFDIDKSQESEMDSLLLEYINSSMISFDNELMALKKMADYLPPFDETK